MSDKAEIMADTVQERVGKLEQRLHTIDYQLGHLEQLPPRVSELERAFAVNQSLLMGIKEDNSALRDSVGQIKQSQDNMAGALDAIPRFIKITLFVITVASLSGVVAFISNT